MKEFRILIEKSRHNKPQFLQLCRDAHIEMTFEKRGIMDTMMFFEDYYSLDFTLMQLLRLGKFIKSGQYKEYLELQGSR